MLEKTNELKASKKASGELSDDDLDNVAGGFSSYNQSEWTIDDWLEYNKMMRRMWGYYY